jgi:microcystin-dependent protein
MPSHNHTTLAYSYFNAYVANQALNAVQNYYQSVGNTGYAGSGLSHNNVQPTMVLNYIIYAGV